MEQGWEEMMDKKQKLGTEIDMEILAPGFMPAEMFQPKPQSPLVRQIAILETQYKELLALCGEMLASIRLPGNAHLFESFPSGWFDLVESWDTRHGRIEKLDLLDQFVQESKQNPGDRR